MNESVLDRRVSYSLGIEGQLHVVENVPARVNLETGEQLFAPATVEHLQRLIRESESSVRVMQAPVYEYM